MSLLPALSLLFGISSHTFIFYFFWVYALYKKIVIGPSINLILKKMWN